MVIESSWCWCLRRGDPHVIQGWATRELGFPRIRETLCVSVSVSVSVSPGSNLIHPSIRCLHPLLAFSHSVTSLGRWPQQPYPVSSSYCSIYTGGNSSNPPQHDATHRIITTNRTERKPAPNHSTTTSMNAIRQSLRPKHQVLVLKCYPQFRKNNNVEVKPNSSELSYLLYYASTRRSKLQKVGDFLDMKTARDVSKARIR